MPPPNELALGQVRRGKGEPAEVWIAAECGGLWMCVADGEAPIWRNGAAVKKHWPVVVEDAAPDA
jgi:hypothetical protein